MPSRGALLHGEGAIPDYSTGSRRRATRQSALPRPRSGEALHGVVDSTGVKGFGEGAWTVPQHGSPYRRTWRKGQVGVDEARGESVAAVVTPNTYHDRQSLPARLAQVGEESRQGSGEGGDDRRPGDAAIQARHAPATIPPPRHAKSWHQGNTQAERMARDETLRRSRHVGRAAWTRESGYQRRRLAGTPMCRLKTLFGERVTARGGAGQAVQVLVRCAVLNRMTQPGRPDRYQAAYSAYLEGGSAGPFVIYATKPNKSLEVSYIKYQHLIGASQLTLDSLASWAS